MPSTANRELAVIICEGGHSQRDIFGAGGRESAAREDGRFLLCPVACTAGLLVVKAGGIAIRNEVVGGWPEGILKTGALRGC